MARGLKRVGRAHLTLTREPHGEGFRFLGRDARAIEDEKILARLIALGIPPAWKQVRIAALASAHVQAIGVDEAGRTQYIYHVDWEERRAEKKQERLAALTAALPRIRRAVLRDLGAETGSQLLAQAICVALIDRTGMRLGRERYLKSAGTRGAGTLYKRDVTLDGDTICIRFPAKGGKKAEYCFTDKRLADALGRMLTLKGRRLLNYRGADGKVRPLPTEAVNTYLRERARAAVSAKDFRTLHASALAGEALSQREAETVTARKRHMASVVREVAEFLRNTPAICRKSYIAPCLFRLYEDGSLATAWAVERAVRGLRRREMCLAAVIRA
jgi:DNA topoisomerase-1